MTTAGKKNIHFTKESVADFGSKSSAGDAVSTVGQTTIDLLDDDQVVGVGTTYHHPQITIAATRTVTVNGSLFYHNTLTINNTGILIVNSGGLVAE